MSESLTRSVRGTDDARPLDVGAVYAAHGGYVWLTLQRLGVAPADLEDVSQEVFVVVHQRLHTYDPSAKLTAWLYGIAVRVVSDYRRRAYRRRERTDEAVGESEPSPARGPEENLARSQARARLHAMLGELDIEKRAVFVMFELDDMGCDQIAETIGVPVGTVYSRLHAARRELVAVAARWRARESRGGAR